MLEKTKIRKTKVKICGLTRYEDAELAAYFGADLLGFVFCVQSNRLCSLEDAKFMIFDFKNTKKVLVFGHDHEDHIKRIGDELLTKNVYFQIPADHSNLSSLEKRYSPKKIIVSFPICKSINDSNLKGYKRFATTILDTGNQKSPDGKILAGGTGVTFDWNYIHNIRTKFFLAGGLSPNNIQEVIETVKPYGVDVSSQIEKAPGIKDHEKMKNFIKKIY